MCACFAYMYVCVPYAYLVPRGQKWLYALELRVELPCVCWEPNQGHLQEQQVPLTTGLPLQARCFLLQHFLAILRQRLPG